MLSHALIGMLEGQYHRRLISTVITTPSIEVSFPITISTEPTYHGLMKYNADTDTTTTLTARFGFEKAISAYSNTGDYSNYLAHLKTHITIRPRQYVGGYAV